MPVKRRRTKSRNRITPEAVEAFRAGDWLGLQLAMNLAPWEINPLDVDGGPSPWPAGCTGTMTWPAAQELRRELEASSTGFERTEA